MRRTSLFAAACIGFCLTSAATHADIVRVPIGTHHQADWPKRGDSEQSVLRQHGAPIKQHNAIGEPPIVRWDYGDFSVYFEQGAVIHSVAVRSASTSALTVGAHAR